MGDKLIRIAGSGEAPVVALSVAAGPRGNCRVRLWDRDGRNPDWVDMGGCDFDGKSAVNLGLRLVSGDPPDVRALDSRTLTWSVRLAASNPDVAQRYDVRILVQQGRQPVPGGEFLYSGPVDEVEELGDMALIEVV